MERSAWRGIIFGIFLFAAIATPSQDPLTMSLMALPMTVLYGVAVVLALLHDRSVARRAPYAGLGDDDASPLPLG